jgi:DNA-binding Lrp family transcriptional regulator
MELNVKQKRLLELLSINCRFSNKDIGKTIGLSEDAVEYQINKLTNQEKIAKFNVQFNFFALGYKQYHLWVKLGNKEIDYDKLNDLNDVTSINSSYGKYDLQLIIISKTQKRLNEIIKKVMEIVGVKKYHLSEFKDFYKRFTNILPVFSLNTKTPTNRKNFVYDLKGRLYYLPDEEFSYKIDRIDKKIITSLLKSPRASYQEISKNTGLNHETVRYRIRNYVKTRLISNFGLIHDFKKYGLYTTYFLFKLKKFDEEELKDLLLRNDHVFYAAKLEGEYNCIIYVVASNPDEIGEQYDKIYSVLSSSIIESDLLFLKKLHKYVQFPEDELN